LRFRLSITLVVIIGVLMVSFVLYYNQKDRRNITESSGSGWTRETNLDHLVLLENENSKNTSDSSLTSTEKVPDYTKMFSDLYTEYSVPVKKNENNKIAYLTFDDGPSENTYDILDLLEERDIKATFFIVGSSIRKEEEDSLKRMINEGHTIGIHTYSHMCDEIYCSVERFLDDFNTVYQQIYDITGERVNIYRFPWGSNNGFSRNIKDALMDEMERRGFTCYDWNVDTKDSVGKPSAHSILHNINKDLNRQDRPIILMHDSGSNDLTVQLLPEIIKMISDKGYVFDTLDQREPYLFPW